MRRHYLPEIEGRRPVCVGRLIAGAQRCRLQLRFAEYPGFETGTRRHQYSQPDQGVESIGETS